MNGLADAAFDAAIGLRAKAFYQKAQAYARRSSSTVTRA